MDTNADSAVVMVIIFTDQHLCQSVSGLFSPENLGILKIHSFPEFTRILFKETENDGESKGKYFLIRSKESDTSYSSLGRGKKSDKD